MTLGNVQIGDPHITAHNEERQAISNLESMMAQAVDDVSARFFYPENYGAVRDASPSLADSAALVECVNEATLVSGYIWLRRVYGLSTELQLVGSDQAASIGGTGPENCGFLALHANARISWSTAPTGNASTGITTWGNPGHSTGWQFDGNLMATRGIFIGPSASHGFFESIWSTRVNGDAWVVCCQNGTFVACVGGDNAGNGWTLDYGIQACSFSSCHGLSNDGWQFEIRQSGGPGWGNSAQPQALTFDKRCIVENGGSPSFANTGKGGVKIREGLDITFEEFELVDIASSLPGAAALVMTPSTANGFVGRITIRSSRIANVHIDANVGGVAGTMGGTNEPLLLEGWNYSVYGGVITNGSTGPVYNTGKGSVSYAAEGTGAPARMDTNYTAQKGGVAEVKIGDILGTGTPGILFANNTSISRNGQNALFHFGHSTMQGPDVTRPALIAKGATNQSGNILEVQSSANAGLWVVGPAGIPRWNATAIQQTTVGPAGGASALPETPTKYLQVKDSAGTLLVIPAYAAS